MICIALFVPMFCWSVVANATHTVELACGAQAMSLVLTVARVRTSFVVSQDMDGNAMLFTRELLEQVVTSSCREISPWCSRTSASVCAMNPQSSGQVRELSAWH